MRFRMTRPGCDFTKSSPIRSGSAILGWVPEPWEDAFEVLALPSARYRGGAWRPGGAFAFIGLSYQGARGLEAAAGNRVLRPLGCRARALTSASACLPAKPPGPAKRLDLRETRYEPEKPDVFGAPRQGLGGPKALGSRRSGRAGEPEVAEWAGVGKPCRCPASPAASLRPTRWPDGSPARSLWVIINAPWY